MWRAFGSVTAASAAVAYVTRPTAAPPATAAAPGDTGGGQHHHHQRDLSDCAALPPTLQAQVMDRMPFPQLLYHVGQHLVVFSCTTVSRVFMYLGGRFRVKEDDHYGTFVARVRRRDPGVPLITVSNHRSMLDDPALVASVLPLSMSYQPKYLRWGVCAQEFCFNAHLPALVHAYCGMGKVMPIKRGAGIDQKAFLAFARRAAAGDWLHVFPEGGIWQKLELGGRHNGREREVGRLKWGVGKLIAHCPQRPVVIPFFHWGMETTMPQHPVTKELLNKGVPVPGHRVDVRFGPELHFDDLIDAHERRHGRLWKYTASVDDDVDPDNFLAQWKSRPEDLELYHQITARIEDALNALNQESNLDHNLPPPLIHKR